MLVRPLDDRSKVVEAAGVSSFTVTRYDVTVSSDTPVTKDWTIEVTEAPFDATLVGQELTVLDMAFDSWQVSGRIATARVT